MRISSGVRAVRPMAAMMIVLIALLSSSVSCKEKGKSNHRDTEFGSSDERTMRGKKEEAGAAAGSRAVAETDADAGANKAAEEIVVGEIWVSDETGAVMPRGRRNIEKADLERIVFDAFRREGGRQRTTAPGRLQVRVAVAKRKESESFIAVSGVLSIDDNRIEANAIGFRAVPKGEGAKTTAREIIERAVRDTIKSLVAKYRVPRLPVDALVVIVRSPPDGGADGDRRLIATGELAERRDATHFDLFIALLKDDDPAVARRAIGALVALKDARAVNPLIDFAARKDPQTLREVIYALGDLGGAKAEAFLWTLEKGHEHPAIRQAAHEAIDLLKKKR